MRVTTSRRSCAILARFRGYRTFLKIRHFRPNFRLDFSDDPLIVSDDREPDKYLENTTEHSLSIDDSVDTRKRLFRDASHETIRVERQPPES